MIKKNKTAPKDAFFDFLQNAAAWTAGLGAAAVCLCFYVRTYDSASVKKTLLLTSFAALMLLCLALHCGYKNIVNKKLLRLVTPFVIFGGWAALSFALNKYKLASLENFIRSIIFIALPVVLALTVNKKHIALINKILLVLAVVVFGYGLVQVADVYCLEGLDIMPWRAFFAPRIFSTFANPNMFGDFTAAMLFVVFANYLKKFEKKYLVLFAAGLINLYFTQSKGAWAGFACASVVFVLAYGTFFADIKKGAKYIKPAFLLLALAALIMTAVFTFKRAQSASFRLVTWQGAWELAAARPLTGHGTGSFNTVYPQYKKTDIFYMENLHNIQTQHAENEFVEVLAENGFIGLLLFVFVIFYLFKLCFNGLAARGAQGHYLLGYGAAMAAMLCHNFFDISMRHASGAVLFAVAAGIVLVLSKEDFAPVKRSVRVNQKFLNFIKILAAAGAVYVFVTVIKDFNFIAGSAAENAQFGRTVLRLLAWAAALGVSGWVMYLLFRVLRGSKSLLAVLCCILSLPVFIVGDKYLLSDCNTNIAYFFVKKQDWLSALDNYTKAIKNNPANTSLYHSRGSIFLNRFETFKTYQPKTGDKNNVFRDDFERALADYNAALKYNPSEPLLHHHAGELYFKKGYEKYKSLRTQEDYREVLAAFERAQEHFTHSLSLDPVNPDTYIRLSNIETVKGNNDKALYWIEKYKQGPQGVTNPAYLAQHKTNAKINALEANLKK